MQHKPLNRVVNRPHANVDAIHEGWWCPLSLEVTLHRHDVLASKRHATQDMFTTSKSPCQFAPHFIAFVLVTDGLVDKDRANTSIGIAKPIKIR